MTTIVRRPLITRQAGSTVPPSTRTQSLQYITNKRPRSPEVGETIHAAKFKRARSGSSQPTALSTVTPNATNTRDSKERKDRLRHKEERQHAKEEFITKYTKAFPSFVFYFDGRDGGNRQLAESRVLSLGAVCPPLFIPLLHFVDLREED